MIPLAVPNLTGKEREYLAQAITQNWVGPDGPFVRRFEEMVTAESGRKWAVATITGTAALHVSAFALGFAGKAIDVRHHAFPAARNVFEQLGCDINLVSGGEHRGGENHDAALYRHSGWPTLCDRAPAIGEYPTEATLECYSFAANKTVTCGHGGAVVGDDESLHDELRRLIRQGHGRPGLFNYRMANINAAIGCAQMERLEEFRDAKRRIWDRYLGAFPMRERGTSRWMATADIEVSPEKLAEAGIEVRPEPSGGISLPCSTNLTEADQDTVIKACEAFLRS